MCFGSRKNVTKSSRFQTGLRKKTEPFRGSPHGKLDGACYKWLVNARDQNISISGTKVFFFSKELVCNDFRAPDGWNKRRREKTFLLRQFQVYVHMFFTFLT